MSIQQSQAFCIHHQRDGVDRKSTCADHQPPSEKQSEPAFSVALHCAVRESPVEFPLTVALQPALDDVQRKDQQPTHNSCQPAGSEIDDRRGNRLKQSASLRAEKHEGDHVERAGGDVATELGAEPPVQASEASAFENVDSCFYGALVILLLE